MMANGTTPDVCRNVNQFNASTLHKESLTSSLRLFQVFLNIPSF